MERAWPALRLVLPYGVGPPPIHRFRRLDLGADVRPMLAEIAIRPQLDLAVAVVDEMLPEVAGGLSLALAQTFRLIDPNVRNPATAQWEQAFLIFDLLL